LANTLPSPAEIPPTEPGRHVPASRLRRTIAQRMSAGLHQAVPVTLTTKINAESLVTCREQLNVESNDRLVPSYNDILIHDAAQTLRELPDLNACWYREGIHSFERISMDRICRIARLSNHIHRWTSLGTASNMSDMWTL
jgi:pyruvate/2-oxoglutarate dehydrogenase complex dihydrolipoamide acyltransferase (E2) component